jgi:dimeric dUTPase (all-alpha-NTP-PPase superfamily)
VNLTELFQMQKDLDGAIAWNLNMKPEVFDSIETIDKRIFALKVEIAEFANATGWFKYWKQSHVMDRDHTLEEHADVMHFMLSVGNSRNYNKFIKELHPEHWEKVPMERLFHYIMDNQYNSSGKWLNAFEQLIQIGYKLGFTEQEMIESYKRKNAENYRRQERNY